MLRPLALLVACALLATAAAGCGGDDAGSGRTQPSGSAGETSGRAVGEGGGARERYIRAADAHCASVNRRYAPLQARAREAGAGAATPEEAVRAAAPVLGRAARVRSRALEQLRAIEPPPADRAALAPLCAAYDRQNGLFASYVDAARAGAVERFAALGRELTVLGARVRELAASYGFRECGRGAR